MARQRLTPNDLHDRDSPRTPTLSASNSNSSLPDLLTPSPSSNHFPDIPSRPLSQTSASETCKSWWGTVGSQTSNSTLAQHEPSSQPSVIKVHCLFPVHANLCAQSREPAKPLTNGLLRPDNATLTPTASPKCSVAADVLCKVRSVFGCRPLGYNSVIQESLLFDVTTEEPSAEFQPAPRPSNPLSRLSQQQFVYPVITKDHSSPDFNHFLARPPIPGTRSTSAIHRGYNSSTSQRKSSHNPASSLFSAQAEMGPPHHMNASLRSSRSMAHCNQRSLVPPSEVLTQTHCGRTALRQAGIAHGSPRALAPPLPVENVPSRHRTESLFHRLALNPFSKSSPGTPAASSSRLPTTPPDTPARGSRKAKHSKPAGHNFVVTLAPNESTPQDDTSSPSRPSRWGVILRFVGKPGVAAKTIAAEQARQTPKPPTTSTHFTNQPEHAQEPPNPRSSSLSFFGDLVDPFARSEGPAATISACSLAESCLRELADGRRSHTSRRSSRNFGTQSSGARSATRIDLTDGFASKESAASRANQRHSAFFVDKHLRPGDFRANGHRQIESA